MRNIIIFVALVALVGCSNPFMDNTTVSNEKARFVIEVNGNGNRAVSHNVTQSNDQLSFSFRSSDIEFWPTDYNQSNLSSFNSGNKSHKMFLTEDTSNKDHNVIFVPGSVQTQNTSGFNLPAGSYDIVRIDMGGGQFSLKYNEDFVKVSSNRIDVNSIILIKGLHEPVLITRGMWRNDKVKLVVNTNYNIINSFYENNTFFETAGQLDVDGALFLPFDGIEIVENQSFSIVFEWDIEGAFNYDEENDVYEMADRVAGYPFDFNVSIAQ